MLSTLLDQPTRASILRLDARSHNNMAADIFGRTPRLAFSIVLTPACGARSDESYRQLLDAVSGNPVDGAIQQVLAGQLSDEQQANTRILLHGKHRVESGFVVIGGDAQVELVGHGVALVFGKASVTARGDFEVYATGASTVAAYDRSRLDVSGNVKVKSYDYVIGVARGSVRGTVLGHSQWQVENEANFDAYDAAKVTGSGQATLRAYGNSRVTGFGKTRVSLFERASGWFDDSVVVDVAGSSVSYVTGSVTVARKIGAARILPWDRS